MSTAPTTLHRHRALQLVLTGLAVLLLAAILIVLLADHHSSAPGSGSGVAATQSRSLPPFNRVDLAGTTNLVVHVGGPQSVIVHADDNLLGRTTTTVSSGRLVVGTTPGNLSPKTPMFVVVTVPSLGAVTLRGEGNIAVTGLNSRNFAVGLPGSGTITVEGNAARLAIAAAGEGTILLRQLIAHDAVAALSGDGTIMLTATHSLEATITGTGTILYGGSPAHVTRSVRGTGTITPVP